MASSSNPKAKSTAAIQTSLQEALECLEQGDFAYRMPDELGKIAHTFNAVAARNQKLAEELAKVSNLIGKEGKLDARVEMGEASGDWKLSRDALNTMIEDLVRPTTEVSRVISAVANGNLAEKMALTIEGQPVQGEFLQIGQTVNEMVDQLRSFADEVTRVAREVGTEGKLGGQARVEGVSGTWKDLTDNVNQLASNLTDQVRNIADVTTAVANGDLSKKVTVDVKGEVLELKDTVNIMVDQLSSFAAEVTRVAREVGTEGKLGGQAQVEGVSGTWEDLTNNVNMLASNLTDQVRNIADVTTAVATGDLSKKVTVDVKGEVLELKETVNTMVDQLSSFAAEVTRVAREVGTEGKLGGQARVEGVSGTWRDLTDNVNTLAENLTNQVRNIADVTTAVATGDLSKKITVDARGEVLELKETINIMVDQLSSFADEVTRVAKEVGTEGRLGGQAEVEDVSGTWRDLTNNVNMLASNLTDQVRNIAGVTTAVATGDLSKKITVDARGEVLELKETINIMVDQLSSFAAEVTRVAKEVGTEGELGGQAQVEGVSGTWRDLTNNVNMLASNLTDQVRNIAEVTTAVASGDLSKKITVDASGEVLQLKETVNTMVDQLSSFADEVTRVAREVGTEGKLGGQAQVEGVSGTWKDLTDNVNQLAGNLTNQVRAIAEVSTSVTQGDLTRSITVETQGELAELKDNVNQMIANLRETTQRNSEQDWLNSNLARFSGMMQGQRDLEAVSSLIMSELTPLVSAQTGAFFFAEHGNEDNEHVLSLVATYAFNKRRNLANRFRKGEGLVGQAYLEKKSILVTEAPGDYVTISSGLGEAEPTNLFVIPIVFEEQVMAVVELGSFNRFSDIHRTFLEQLSETIGVVLNTIVANMRTEELLAQSQSLTTDLQNQQEELQQQQEELRHSNEELEQQARSLQINEQELQAQQTKLSGTNKELETKAHELAEQNSRVEVKNREIEAARAELEEKASQLSTSSKYKSEFLANMSHELRTPLNSLLILSKMLADNSNQGLTEKEVEYARTINNSGNELLELINDILDLSKVEAGKMDISIGAVTLENLVRLSEQTFEPLASAKDITLSASMTNDCPEAIATDEQRLWQVLKNLLSNAVKFTKHGSVGLSIFKADDDNSYQRPELQSAHTVIAFQVTDTGIGISEEQLALIFEAFQQGDGTTSRKFGGTGLGLSISREIARILGGEIRVASTQDEGSIFTLLLPASPSGQDLQKETLPAPTPMPSQVTITHDLPDNEAQQITSTEKAETEELSQGQTPARNRTVTAEERHAPASLLAPSSEQAPTRNLRVADDRENLDTVSRLMLIVEDDPAFADILLTAVHEGGYQAIITGRGDETLQLAEQYQPQAMILDLQLPGLDGMSLLEKIKSNLATRHIPVYVVSGMDREMASLAAGAIGYLEKPATRIAIDQGIQAVSDFIDRSCKRLLLIEDDPNERLAITELISGHDEVDVIAVPDTQGAMKELERATIDCIVLDLTLGTSSGLELLESLKGDQRFKNIPVIVHTGRELDNEEIRELESYAETIILKNTSSPERLLDETALYLHRNPNRMTEQERSVLERLHFHDEQFKDKRILVVDDDARNAFALTNLLEAQGLAVVYAENGIEALAMLESDQPIDLVLMDIMMPEMDGFEATRAIRDQDKYADLPIITLTAKAMKEDRENSMAAGASDYITKPVDVDQLLSLIRVWLLK